MTTTRALYISRRLFSTDNPKAAKALHYGFINAIHYLAPSDISGHQLCANASPGCIALCLGFHSGQAAMVSNSSDPNSMNSVRRSRIIKAQQWATDPDAYMAEMCAQASRIEAKAWREGLGVVFRLDGSSDLGLAVRPFWVPVRNHRATFAELHPQARIDEYTKAYPRMIKFLRGDYPRNVHMTFSRSETNEAQCLDVLAMGGNVAAVFRRDLPASWNGYEVIDGDKHDLRHLDPRGVVVGLRAKGSAAKRDTSGFVIDGVAA